MTDPYAYIDEYLTGELATRQRRAFEQALASDEALAAAVATQRKIRAAASRSRPDLRAIMEDIRTTSSPPQDAPERQFPYRFFGWLAAGLLVVGFIFWAFSTKEKPVIGPPTPEQIIPPPSTVPPPPSELAPPIAANPDPPPPKPEKTITPPPDKRLQLALTHYEPYEPITVRASDTINERDSTLQAIEAYRNKDWKVVLNLASDQDTEGIQLRAHAAFRAKDFVTARKYFMVLAENVFYQEYAEWNQLLCLAAAGQFDTAVYQEIKERVSTPSHSFADLAVGF
ncbi:MAG: hypothetical protein AAFZ52_16550 [Bacteroidota bacterium]